MDQSNSPSGFNRPGDENLDLKRYLSLFISNWYWFAITLFITLAIAYGINRYSEKVYTVSATLLIKDDQIGRVSSNVESVIPGGDIFKSQQNLKNEIGILQSFRLNDSVMNKLAEFHVVYVNVGRRGIVETRMYKKSPFKVIYDSLEIQRSGIIGINILSDTTYKIELEGNPKIEKLKKFGERFKEHGFDFTIIPRFKGSKIYSDDRSNNYYFYFVNPESLANQYRGKLSVTPIEKEASIVTLSVSGLDPIQEADYLNMLMDVYIDYGLENKTQTAEQTIRFIDAQIKIISDSLIKAEGIMEKFRQKNRFFDLSHEGSLIQSKLDKAENEKTSLELQLRYYGYLSEYINLKKSGETIISPSLMGITDDALYKLIDELSSIQKEKEKLGFNLEENQKALEFLDNQTKETNESLRENIKNGIANLNLSIAESDKKILSVDTMINKLPATEREFIKIQRTFDLNNTVYTYLLEKRAESGIARASNIPDNRIIDKASLFSSGLIKPKTRQNYMMALVFGLFLPMLGIFLIDYFNDKVIDKRDVEKKTRVPVIGYIGHSDGHSQMPVVNKPGSSLAESFRAVRTSLKYFSNENQVPVITITSTISSEGKTFISMNLAAIIAMLGKKVLLVGLDLRKPRIDKIFNFDRSDGMSTFLSGSCNYEDVIKETSVANLFYVPSGPVPPNPAELIETENMRIFVEKARLEFDCIIIDTPPVAIVTDALLLANYADINLYIVRQRYTSRNTLELIEQLREQKGLRNMAIILNDISLSGYYGYGLRYGYSLGYGYSYGYNYYNNGYYERYGSSRKSSGYYNEDSDM
jgi:tyrosine-protein kinase Etk/Wzc